MLQDDSVEVVRSQTLKALWPKQGSGFYSMSNSENLEGPI